MEYPGFDSPAGPMSMMKCSAVGCSNPVAKIGEQCDECKRNDLSYGI